MPGDIKGITIEFGADTSKLERAIKDINSSTRSLDSELRKVNTALKFNPKNIELWRQKQQLLTQKIDETQRKVQLLKQKQAQMDAKGVDRNSKEYRELQREIIQTESKLKTFKGQLKGVGSVRLKAVSAQFKSVGQSLQSAGQAMRGFSMAGAAVTASLGAMAYKAGVAADDINTLSKVYHIGTRDLQQYNVAAGLVDVSTETIAKSHQKLSKTMASAMDGTGKSAEAFKTLGVDITNADGSLRSSDAVWQDTIAALGQVSNETQRDALAMQLMGRSASELNPLIADGGKTYEKVAKTLNKYGLDFVDQETLDKANEFNDSIDMIKAIGLTTFQTLGSQLAAYLAPALEKVVDWAGRLAGWLSNLSPTVLTVVGVIGALVAAIAPVLLVVGKLAMGINAIITLWGTIGPMIAGLAGPIGIAVAVIAGLVAAGILLYKNWDKIKAKAIEIKAAISAAFQKAKTKVLSVLQTMASRISAIFTSIKNVTKTVFKAVLMSMTAPIRTALSIIKGLINKIKSLFHFKVSLPHIKLPHFAISPPGWKIGDLLKGKKPTLGIKWYDQGGIFRSPSVIGVGERRPEFVGALDDLRKIVRSEAGGGNTINIYSTVTGATDPEEYARALVRQLKLEMRAT